MEFITFDGALKELSIEFNAEGWGPQSGEKMAAFEDVPYAHFDKKDKLCRAADFTQQTNVNQRSYSRRREEPAHTEFAYKHDAVEDSTFRLVDTSRSTTKKQLGRTFSLPSLSINMYSQAQLVAAESRPWWKVQHFAHRQRRTQQ